MHRDGRDKFLEKCGFKEYPKKTEEWQSAGDLASDKTFPMGKIQNIKKQLIELQSKMPEFIQIRKPTMGPARLCLHRDGREEFLKHIQSTSKTKSFGVVAKTVGVVNALHEAKGKNIKSGSQHQM